MKTKPKTSLFIFFILTLSGLKANAEITLRGYNAYGGQSFFSLHDDQADTSAWVTLGDEFLGHELVSYEAKDEKLRIKNRASNQFSILTLSSAKTPSSQPPALPKLKALVHIKRSLEQSLAETPRSVKMEDVPLEIQEKIKRDHHAGASMGPSSVQLSPVSEEEKAIIGAQAEKSGYIMLQEAATDGKYAPVFLRPLQLGDLPPFLAQNLTQSDLDALLPLQIEATRASSRNTPVGKSGSAEK